MRPVNRVHDAGPGSYLIKVKPLYQILLGSIHRSDMPEIRRASNTKLVVSRTITLQLRMGESCTRVTIGVVDKLAVSVLLRTTSIDGFVK